MRIPATVLFISFCFSVASAQEIIKVESVYDADTFRVSFGCSMDLVCKNVPVRASGFDSPEIRGKCEKEKVLANEAREFTLNFVKSGVMLENCKRGKYYRIICDVRDREGKALSDEIIKKGYAREYHGEKRGSWCD